MKKILLFAVSMIFLTGLFLNTDNVSYSVKNSIDLCMNTLIPSLFPFMVIALFMSLSGAGSIFSFILSPFTKKVLNLPAELGQTVLFSLIGGYPSGARLLGSLVDDNVLSERDAGTLLGFCVSPGPAFVVLAVGKGMFGSAKTGVIFLLSQLFSSLIIGAVLCRKYPVKFRKTSCNAKSLYISFVQAVSQSSSGILTIVSYVVITSSLIGALGIDGRLGLSAIVLSLAEVTSGCAIASSIGGTVSCILASFLLSFGGISVCCQIAALSAEYSIPVNIFIKSRLICGVLSAFFTGILMRIFPQAALASSQLSSPIAASSGNRMIGAVCLCAMIAITFSKASLRENVDF